MTLIILPNSIFKNLDYEEIQSYWQVREEESHFDMLIPLQKCESSIIDLLDTKNGSN